MPSVIFCLLVGADCKGHPIFHRRVWYRAISLRCVRIRSSGIILTPTGYPCAKFRFFGDLHGKNGVLNHAINQSLNRPAYFMPREPKLSLRKRISENCRICRSYLRVTTSFYASLCRTDKLGTAQYSATADACTTAVSHWLNVTYMARPHPSPRHLQMTFNNRSLLPQRSNALSFSAKKSTPNPSKKAHLLLIRGNDV